MGVSLQEVYKLNPWMGDLFTYSIVSESEGTTRLLNSQAMTLDVADIVDLRSYHLHPLNVCSPDSSNSKVIPLVPPDWLLSAMSSFLAQVSRRMLHAKHGRQIVKAVSAGQNLEVCIGIVSCQMYSFAYDLFAFAFAVIRWLTALDNKAPSKRPTRMRPTRAILTQKTHSTRKTSLRERSLRIYKTSVSVEEMLQIRRVIMIMGLGKKFGRDN
jgi:hypothetical protein